MRKKLVIVIGVILSFFATPALGQEDKEKEKAISHFNNGISLMEVEDFAGATVEFEASVALYPSKNALFNLGMCYKATHHYVESQATFRRLKADFAATLDEETLAEVDKNIESLQRLLAEIEVIVSEPGATVFLEGEEVGQSPLPAALVVKVGQHRVKVTLEGFKTQERMISVTGGSREAMRFELGSDAPPVPVVAPVVAPPPEPTPPPQPAPETVQQPEQQGAKSELKQEDVTLPKEMSRIFSVYGAGVGMQSIAGVAVLGITIGVGFAQEDAEKTYVQAFPLIFGLAHLGASFMGGAIVWSIGNKSKYYDVPFWAPLVGALVGNGLSFGLGMITWNASKDDAADGWGTLIEKHPASMLLGYFVGPLLLPPVFEALFYGLFRKPEARYSTNAAGHPSPWRAKWLPPTPSMMATMDGTGRTVPSIMLTGALF